MLGAKTVRRRVENLPDIAESLTASLHTFNALEPLKHTIADANLDSLKGVHGFV